MIASEGGLPAGQLAQDAFALGFSQGIETFLDIGAGHPEFLSNTYVLQSVFGWSGVLVEPNPQFADLLRRQRASDKVSVVESALAADARDVDFVPIAELGTFLEHVDHDDHALERRAAMDAVGTVPMRTVAVREFVEGLDVTQLDFLSVDTEGSEFEIVKAFPFKLVEVNTISIEHNERQGYEARITRLLRRLGFRRVLPTISAWDAWYVRD